MNYKIDKDEMQIILGKGDLQTDPPPSLSPTCASAMVVGLEEVKKLLVDLLPVVEDTIARYTKGSYRRHRAATILPRLRKMIEELP